MQTLSILKTSPFETNAFELYFDYGNNTSLILMQDAVIAACGDNKWQTRLKQIPKLYILENDLKARGLSAQIGQTITYAKFVELTELFPKIQSW